MWGFTNCNFKLNLKVPAFYLEKQKSLSLKKIFFKLYRQGRYIQKMAFAVSIFQKVLSKPKAVRRRLKERKCNLFFYMACLTMINIILVSVYFEVFFTYHLLFEKNLTKVSIYFSKNSLNKTIVLALKVDEINGLTMCTYYLCTIDASLLIQIFL